MLRYTFEGAPLTATQAPSYERLCAVNRRCDKAVALTTVAVVGPTRCGDSGDYCEMCDLRNLAESSRDVNHGLCIQPVMAWTTGLVIILTFGSSVLDLQGLNLIRLTASIVERLGAI